MSIMASRSVVSSSKTCTASVTPQATKEWIKLFPQQVTQTYTSSVAFMKQLTVIAVSTITYLKEVFPQDSYISETFGGVGLRILKAKCEDESAQFISTALIQSFEALEKKYLGKLVLCLHEDACVEESLVEAHSFEFTYSPAGVSMDVRSATRDCGAANARFSFENIRERTLNLLQACVVVSQSTQREQQEPYDVSLRLYYNNAAPAGYQVPGFSPAGAEPRDPLAGALAAAAVLGWVETPFHTLAARSYIRDIGSSHEANASPNVPMMTQNEGDNFDSELQVSPSQADGREAPPAAVRCACAYRIPDADREPLITCDYCGTLQHAVCYGIQGSSAPARHCCVRCSELQPARAPTCPDLARLPPKHREMLCLYRHALVWAARARALGAGGLRARFQLSAGLAHKLARNLHSHGVLRGRLDDLDSPQKIDRERLRVMIDKYFQSAENTLVERLLAESLSQEDPPDPVGDVLGPVGQVSLQNATTIGKVIQHTPLDNAVEDLTLKQYREAIFTTKGPAEEDLPLSGSHNPVQNIGKKENTVAKRKADEPDGIQLRSRLRTKRSKDET